MSDPLFSPSWYRVAGLKPRIRAHVRIDRQVFRGNVWFVLQDPAADRAHRFSPAAHHFIGLMDGERTVQELWDATSEHLGDDAPTQAETIRLLGQLHAADALLMDVPPDSLEVFRRHERHERQAWKRRLLTPLALRFPLLDPDRFLVATLPAVSWLFSWVGAVLWLAVVGAGAVLAASHWTDLTENIVDRVLSPQNLVLLWFVYPVVKVFHELGHAYAVRRWGGEVHDIGIMLLVFTPVPYVDASAATGFRDKRQRMLVGAMGIAVELFLGSVALFVWLNVQPGAVSAVAYNVMVISGISTLLFNGNPLLRFDGYYVLSDAIGIPNLGARSNRYLGYLFQRYVLRIDDAISPADSRGERIWMAVYGIASFIYRVVIMFVMIVFVATRFFFVGVLVAIWAISTQAVTPIAKSVSFLFKSPVVSKHRGRSVAVTAAIAAAVMLLLWVVPAPSWTRAEGVVWVPEEAQVRAGADGFIDKLLAPGDSQVVRGQPLVQAEDPFLSTNVQVVEAQLAELGAQYDAVAFTDRVRAAMIADEIVAVEGTLERTRERERNLLWQSPANGRLVLPNGPDLPGRFVTKGQLVGYVIEPRAVTVRAVLAQDDIAQVRGSTRAVEVMLSGWDVDPVMAKVRREVPAGSPDLPTAVLGSTGGGALPVDPRDSKGLKSLSRVFQVELELPPDVRTPYLGSRVYVKFVHNWEPVGFQLYRSFRRLLLSRFDV